MTCTCPSQKAYYNTDPSPDDDWMDCPVHNPHLRTPPGKAEFSKVVAFPMLAPRGATLLEETHETDPHCQVLLVAPPDDYDIAILSVNCGKWKDALIRQVNDPGWLKDRPPRPRLAQGDQMRDLRLSALLVLVLNPLWVLKWLLRAALLVLAVWWLCSCEPPEKAGHLGWHCKADGTCQGRLSCVKRWYPTRYGVDYMYRCALPGEPTAVTQ